MESGNGSEVQINLTNRDFYQDIEEEDETALKTIIVSQTGKNSMEIFFPEIPSYKGNCCNDLYFNDMHETYAEFKKVAFPVDSLNYRLYQYHGEFEARVRNRNKILMDRLNSDLGQRLLNPDMTKLPIPQGIFKGTNSFRGIEFLSLSYPGNNILLGTKITGDEKVAMNKICFRADLTKALILSKDEQKEMDESTFQAYAEDVENHHNIDFSDKDFVPPPQEFYFQRFLYDRELELERETDPLMNHCQFRFVADAKAGYPRPPFFPAQVVIFDCDHFAVLFQDYFDFKKIGYYSRIKGMLASPI